MESHEYELHLFARLKTLLYISKTSFLTVVRNGTEKYHNLVNVEMLNSISMGDRHWASRTFEKTVTGSIEACHCPRRVRIPVLATRAAKIFNYTIWPRFWTRSSTWKIFTGPNISEDPNQNLRFGSIDSDREFESGSIPTRTRTVSCRLDPLATLYIAGVSPHH